MYYSYKSKRRNKKLYRYLLLILIILSLLYFGYTQKQYIFFWDYTYNKLIQKFEDICRVTNLEKRRVLLKEICRSCNEYREKNPISSEAFSLSSKIHYKLGEIYLDNTFSELVIGDDLYKMTNMNENAKAELIEAIKNARKGMALSPDNEDVEQLLILAKAYFYTGYNDIDNIYHIVRDIDDFCSLEDTDGVRFCAIINILKGQEEYGLYILKEYGRIEDSIKGQLFMASANRIAKRYTNSIMEYKQILNKTSDNEIIKLININLGKIYFSQSLYRESLSHFVDALKINGGSDLLKIWIGKSYSALGDKIKAKAIWNEVLTSDNTNKEARMLLGLM